MSNTHFTLSKSKAIEQYEEVKRHCDVVSYSAKTNYDIIPLLRETTDAAFSIHTESAYQYIERPGNTTYFPQGWNEDELTRLHGKGVYTYVVENTEDLKTLQDWTAKHEASLNVMLRLKLKENTVKTGKHYVFGMTGNQVNRALTRLKDNPAVSQLGVHVHRKSQNVAEWGYKDELLQTIHEHHWEAIDLLNIGGGFPVQYKNYSRNTWPLITNRLDEIHAFTKQRDITLIAEPGRIIAAPAGKLHATIRNVYDSTVVLDCSVYNAAMDTFVTNTRLEIQEELPENEGKAYTVKGFTPDSLDIFRYKVRLNNPEKGDTLTFLNATAYNYRSDFCNLPEIPTEIVE